MYQPQLNHDQALLKLAQLHHEAHVRSLVQRSREQGDIGVPSRMTAGDVLGSLGRMLLRHLHASPAQGR